jgi:hypothetical protein
MKAQGNMRKQMVKQANQMLRGREKQTIICQAITVLYRVGSEW